MNQAADRAAFEVGLRSSEVVGDELRLVLNNTIAAIEDGRQQILRRLEPLGLSARVVNRLEVVFEEVVSNIVRHGFEPHSDQTILVVVATRPGAVDLTVEDDGAPFDPLAAPEPEPLRSLETARLGGLGVPLLRKLSASLRYEAPDPGAAPRDLGGRPFRPRNRLMLSIATE
jgi:serine/threonine-protein kinase RsbW